MCCLRYGPVGICATGPCSSRSKALRGRLRLCGEMVRGADAIHAETLGFVAQAIVRPDHVGTVRRGYQARGIQYTRLVSRALGGVQHNHWLFSADAVRESGHTVLQYPWSSLGLLPSGYSPPLVLRTLAGHFVVSGVPSDTLNVHHYMHIVKAFPLQ